MTWLMGVLVLGWGWDGWYSENAEKVVNGKIA